MTSEQSIQVSDASDASVIDPGTAWCMRCAKQVPVQNPTHHITKNNRNMIKGTCPSCFTKLAKILGKADIQVPQAKAHGA